MSGEQMAFIVFDWCGWNESNGRFTHMPSGDTLICKGWMGQREWDQAQSEFFAKYPGVKVYRCLTGPYRKTDDLMGTTDEIVERLKTRLG